MTTAKSKCKRFSFWCPWSFFGAPDRSERNQGTKETLQTLPCQVQRRCGGDFRILVSHLCDAYNAKIRPAHLTMCPLYNREKRTSAPIECPSSCLPQTKKPPQAVFCLTSKKERDTQQPLDCEVFFSFSGKGVKGDKVPFARCLCSA